MADVLNRSDRVRAKYIGGSERLNARTARDRRLSSRRRMTRMIGRIERQQRALDSQKTMDDIVKERNMKKAQAKIREAQEKGILNQKQVKDAKVLKQAQERLRQNIRHMLKGMEHNSELQQRGFRAMENGNVDGAIQDFGEGKNGAVGNEYAGIDSKIAEDLRILKKTGGDKVVHQSMKEALTMAVPADAINRREEYNAQRNLEGDQTKKSTGEEMALEMRHRRAHGGR